MQVGIGSCLRAVPPARGLLALTLVASGCTIFAPIQAPEHDRRFPLKIEDQEPIPCVSKQEGTPVACTSEVKQDLDAFYGDLGRALWETDLRRRTLIGMGSERTTLNSLYNAMLWPLGAFFITKKIHHPEWSTLDAAAIATASYGLLNSGIPDRDKAYLRTASRMACAMVAFEPDLYLKSEIGVDDASLYPPTLLGRTRRLSNAISDFTLERDQLVATLPTPRPQTPPSQSLSSIYSVRATALNLKPAVRGDNGQQLLNSFMDETDRLLKDAREQLTQAQTTATEIKTSGQRLRQQRGRMDFALTQALNANTPDLVSPQDRAREIASALELHLSSTKAFNDRIASATLQSGNAKSGAWTLTDQKMSMLGEPSRKHLLTFWNVKRRELIRSQAEVAEWMVVHNERIRLARTDAAAMGCNDGTLDEFSKGLLKRVGDAMAAQPPASGASK
jgi:hypothetical protein